MSRFNVHHTATAPEATAPILDGAAEAYGIPVDAAFSPHSWSRPEAVAV